MKQSPGSGRDTDTGADAVMGVAESESLVVDAATKISTSANATKAAAAKLVQRHRMLMTSRGGLDDSGGGEPADGRVGPLGGRGVPA